MTKYLISELKFNRKPEGAEIGRISNSMVPAESDVPELFNRLIQGHSFTPGFCSPTRTNENWKGAQVFALDYDSGVSLDEALTTWREVNLLPSFMYYSFSHKSEHPKFRLVWCFDKWIEHIDLWRVVQKALMSIGGEDKKVIDRSCKDPARLFFGGTSGELFSEQPIQFEEHLATFENFGTLTGRKVNVLKERKLIRAESGTKSCNTYDNNISITKKGSHFEKLQKYDFDLAVSRSPVLQSFVKGERLHYPELFALATNMIYIHGGEKWMREHLLKAGCYEAYHHNILPTIKHYNYLPSRIENFDPSLVGEVSNLLSLGYDLQRGKAEIIDVSQREKKPQDVVSSAVGGTVTRVDYSISVHRDNALFFGEITGDMGMIPPPKAVTVIKAGTGSGKTEHLVKLRNVLIAVPTHELKDELVKRMQDRGIPVIATPELPLFSNHIREQIETFYSLGQNKRATELLRQLASNSFNLFSRDRDDQATLRDSQLATEYLDALEQAHNSECTCITTHTRAMLSSSQFKNKRMIVFDEDPLKTILPTTTLRVQDLLLYKHTLLSVLDQNTQFSQIELDFDVEDLQRLRDRKIKNKRQTITDVISIIDSITAQDKLVSNPVPKWRLTDEMLTLMSESVTGQRILQLTHADFMFRETSAPDNSTAIVDLIHIVKRNDLPTQIPVMICSATATKDIYQRLVPDAHENLSFFDLGLVQNKKPVIQYTGKMYSKNQLKQGQLPDVDPDASIITFLRSKKLFNNSDERVHFFNTEGYDHLKGKKVAVVGTPLYKESYIHLIASSLGIDQKGADKALKEYREFIINGVRFSCFTYADDELAKLDIQLTLTELEQASGRARTGVSEAELTIFSNIPTLTADEFRQHPNK